MVDDGQYFRVLAIELWRYRKRSDTTKQTIRYYQHSGAVIATERVIILILQ